MNIHINLFFVKVAVYSLSGPIVGRLVTELGVRKELPHYSYFSCYLVYMVVLVVILYAVS